MSNRRFLKANVCVIGAGITGLTAAINLQAKNYQVIVVDAQEIGQNASTYNAGQVVPCYALPNNKISLLLGESHAKQLADLAEDGVQHIIQTINTYNIDCGLYKNEYFIVNDIVSAKQLINTMQKNYINYHENDIHWISSNMFDDEKCDDIMLQKNTWCLDTGKYIQELAKNFLKNEGIILTNTLVTKIATGKYKKIYANNYEIEADHVVIATGAQVIEDNIQSALLSIPTYIFSTTQISSPLNLPLNFAIANKNSAVHYLRYISGNKLMLGCHPAINMTEVAFIKQIKNQICNVLPECQDIQFETVIAENISITNNLLPYVGQKAENVFFAHGCAGKGIAVGATIGNAIANAITKENLSNFLAFANINHHPMRKPPVQLIQNKLERLREICLLGPSA